MSPRVVPVGVLTLITPAQPRRVVGGAEFGEAVAVAGAAGENEFAVGGEL
jgi:hypothetical protein